MNASSKITAAVTAAALLAVAFAYSEWRAAQEASSAVRGLQAGVASLTEKLGENAQALHRKNQQASALRREVAQAQLARAAAANPVNRRRWIGTHPEALASYLTAYRDAVGGTYGPLFRTLHLSADQIDKLQDILTQREAKDLTVGDAPDLNIPLTRTNNEAIRAVVGRDNYQAVHDYLRETAVVPLVADVAAAAAASNTPLTDTQAVQLTDELAASSQHRANTATVLNTVNWNRAMQGAQGILTPTQLRILGLVQEENSSLQQMRQLEP